jgi:sulfotransferase family protein
MKSKASLATSAGPAASMQRDTAVPSLTIHTKADVLHIGYPKAASTFLVRFLQSHSQITVDQFQLSDLLQPTAGALAIGQKPCADKVHVSKDENVAESVCVVGDLKNWQRYLYVPGAWDRVKDDVIVDPAEAAFRLHKVHPEAKVLIVIREQSDWMQSVYKFVMSQLPWNRRSFFDYCMTPSGIVLLQAGHFDQTIRAYIDVFGSSRIGVLRFEGIARAPERFAADLCNFIGVSERPLPQRRENETHAQIARIQRFFPFIEQLPRGVKDMLKPHVMRLIPGARRSILSSRDISMLRSIYAASNQRTEKLIDQLSRPL